MENTQDAKDTKWVHNLRALIKLDDSAAFPETKSPELIRTAASADPKENPNPKLWASWLKFRDQR